jgi:hypothetical protein
VASRTPQIRALQAFLLQEQQRAEKELLETGELKLLPGRSYSLSFDSFCVHGGAPRPITGDGFLLGPLRGAPKDWLPELLRNYARSGVTRDQAQSLIWALLSEVDVDQLSSTDKSTLRKLMPDFLLRFRHRRIERKMLGLLAERLPLPLTEGVDQLDRWRSEYRQRAADFAALEAIFSPPPERSEALSVGWIQMPEGHQIRVTSQGYERTDVEIRVPRDVPSHPTFRPTDFIALPQQGQRLALSPKPVPLARRLGLTPERTAHWLRDLARQPLTPTEMDLILAHPMDALRVREAQKEALELSRTLFPNLSNHHNNEADAVRHFLWSCLSAQKVGVERAREFLEAHENGSGPENERRMDLHNNEAGLQAATRLPYGSEAALREEARKALQQGRLRVLAPSSGRAS